MEMYRELLLSLCMVAVFGGIFTIIATVVTLAIRGALRPTPSTATTPPADPPHTHRAKSETLREGAHP